MRVFHAADIHLGRRRLDGRLPDKDFAEAFTFIATRAVEEKADVLLIAGDLFDKSQVEPPHLRQAQQALSLLKKAAIPVVAIEGNHDKAFIHSEAATWLQYLAEDDLLILLRTPFDSTGPLMKRWENPREGGAWLDIAGVRFVGAGYLGAATPHKVRQIVARLESGRSHVLLLHAGPDYFVGEGGGFSKEDLQGIRERLSYLALGHIHKPMRHEDWACNPGSPENCDAREAEFPEPRGYAVLEIDPARQMKPLALEIRNTPRRKWITLTLDCSPFGNKLKRGAEALVDAAVDLINTKRPGTFDVIVLRLTGTLNLDRIALDQRSACSEIEQAAKVCAVCLDTSGLNVESPVVPGQVTASEGLSREDLEKAAISNLVKEDSLWGVENRNQEFAGLFYELKEAARIGKTPDDLADQIARSPLVSAIQTALRELANRETRLDRDRWKETGASATKGFGVIVQTAESQSSAL